MAAYQYYADMASRVVGAAAIFQGLAAQSNPAAKCGAFGFKITNPREALFYPAVGGRNLGIGMAALIMSFRGQRESLATLLGCVAVTGVLDIVATTRDGGRWQGHFIGTAVLGLLSWMLW